jgi:hypothetical protein
MDWLESPVFCGVHADDCAHNNGYNNEDRCFLSGPVPGGYKYGDLALQVEGVSNLRE